MNEQLFKQTLEQLTELDWQSLLNGHGLLIIDDSDLIVGGLDAPKSLFHVSDFDVTSALDLKAHVTCSATEILENYYKTNPLTHHGFNRQVEAMVEEYGVEVFSAVVGEIAERTLFVEGGVVISETADSPRHRFGVYFEVDQPLSISELKDAFNQWLVNHSAYFEYVGMSVSRYSF